ncbi:uncharacterized protein LOC121785489 [Salvia splendens]|uniref:uncharacterized protein LOC121785489 n=1 Tax=Salvia splendens TaxID=180675 RepID=UPI001C263AAE|nr:uncharacterized protein LOC121785489 [Salvia splendens]
MVKNDLTPLKIGIRASKYRIHFDFRRLETLGVAESERVSEVEVKFLPPGTCIQGKDTRASRVFKQRRESVTRVYTKTRECHACLHKDARSSCVFIKDARGSRVFPITGNVFFRVQMADIDSHDVHSWNLPRFRWVLSFAPPLLVSATPHVARAGAAKAASTPYGKQQIIMESRSQSLQLTSIFIGL